MTTLLTIDGEAQAWKLPESAGWDDLMDHLQQQIGPAGRFLDSVEVDGTEMLSRPDPAIARRPACDAERIEVRTMSGHEFACGTIKDLHAFTWQLEEQCERAAEACGNSPTELAQALSDLSAGIDTFVRSVSLLKGVKASPSAGSPEAHGVTSPAAGEPSTPLAEIQLLEADLLSLLQELANYQEAGQLDYAAALLRDHLRGVFTEWREKGLGALKALVLG